MFAMLLQRGFNPPAQRPGANPAGNPFDNPAFAAGAIIGGCLSLLFLAVAFAAFILVMVRAMQALQEVRKRNRQMEPGMVWLSLIPLFGIVWVFMVVTKTAASLADEFDDRRLRVKGDNGKSTGMTYAIIGAVNVLVGLVGICVPFVGCVNFLLFIAQIVTGFLYAGKLKAATQRLRNDSGDDGDDDRPDDDGEFDDEPAPRPKPKAKKPREDDDFDEFDEFDPPKKGR